MDTLTHTLAGLLLGESAAHVLPAANSKLPQDVRRGLFVSLLAVGSNLPDMDFIYSVVTGSKLDYLLHHRGHTHTIVGVMAGAALLSAFCELWIRWRGLQTSRHDRLQLLGLAALGPMLHVAMDATNTYGVHPFWPFNNQWFYGDSVFIIEPAFWAAATPLLFLIEARWLRRSIALLMAVGLGWTFSSGLIPWFFCGLLVAGMIGLAVVSRQASARVALLTGMGIWSGVTAILMAAHGVAIQRVEAFIAQRYPQAILLEAALTPMPVNPLCWEVVSAQVDNDRYILRRAVLALAPTWLPANRCPQRRLDAAITVPVQPVSAAGAPNWQWFGEVAMPRDRLASLAARRCEAAAFLRFSRIPWAVQSQGRWLLGDLRYDREPEPGFSEIELSEDSERCPRHMPPWIPPRQDLLE